MNSIRIIVTGGLGFIGTHLVKELETTGHTVRIADIRSKEPIDITRYSELRNLFEDFMPDQIIHLAAITSIPECEQFKELAYRVNVEGTENVVDLCKKKNVRLIFSSSSAVYGNPSQLPTPEDSSTNPVNVYGDTKVKAEKQISTLDDYVILRIFNAYGPSCRRSLVIPDTIKKIREGLNPVPVLGTGFEERDFIYVSDVVNAILYTVRVHNLKGVFNIGTGLKTSIKGLLYLLAELFGKHDLHFKFAGKLRLGDFLVNQASIRKITAQTSWRPQYTLRKGLKETIEQ